MNIQKKIAGPFKILFRHFIVYYTNSFWDDFVNKDCPSSCQKFEYAGTFLSILEFSI